VAGGAPPIPHVPDATEFAASTATASFWFSLSIKLGTRKIPSLFVLLCFFCAGKVLDENPC
jgi:hypothetical protein